MHTDRKIGFAMGILLIGIVAALFFRNEPLVDTRVPIVRRERELNERLRERDVAVYLKEEKAESKEAEVPEDDHPWALRDVLKSMDARNKSRPSPIGKAKARTEADTVDRPEELKSTEKFRTVKEAPDDDAGDLRPVPIPMPAASAIDTAKSDPGKLPPLMPVKPLETVAPLGEPAEPVVAEDPVFQIPEEFDEYTVKYGDTLSGIAEKMLGSQARYRDIYEANRDRMTSPDRLDVGKPLRIPRIAGNTPKVY